MTQTEALKLALEALEGVLDDSPKVLEASISGGLYEVVQCREAITAIKEALAQEKALQALHDENERLGLYKDAYAQPAVSETHKQKPVAWLQIGVGPLHEGDVIARTTKPKEWNSEWWKFEPLYTTPPQRTWVGLTDEEIADCAEKMEASDPTDSFWREFFRGIEAKLKDKNL